MPMATNPLTENCIMPLKPCPEGQPSAIRTPIMAIPVLKVYVTSVVVPAETSNSASLKVVTVPSTASAWTVPE